MDLRIFENFLNPTALLKSIYGRAQQINSEFILVPACRLSKLSSVRSVDYLRVAGSAFLVTGTVHYTGHDRALSKVYEGPCMLPATPALYWCTTDVKVSVNTRSFLPYRYPSQQITCRQKSSSILHAGHALLEMECLKHWS